MKWFVVVVVLSVVGVAVADTLPEQDNKAEAAEKQGTQVLKCYENADYTGDAVRLISFTPDLIPYSFDNRISSCTVNGVWLLYDDYYYNSNNFQAPVYFAWGEELNVVVPAAFNNKASSARLAGRGEGYKFDTVTFYDGEHFMGLQNNIFQDRPALSPDNLGRSLIVTGCSPWTLYENADYGGACTCVAPQDTSNCYPGFYETTASLGGLSQKVSSARRGCFCAKTSQPTKTGKEGFFGTPK